LVELSAAGASAALTLAFALVLDAQRRGEPAAWIAPGGSAFYPPDAAEGGVDLAALAVVRTADLRQALRAADHLARSGAFGLVVLDLGEAAELPLPAQTRLAGLAARHDAVLLFLTRKGAHRPSLGSLVSLRAEAGRERDPSPPGAGGFRCGLRALKDKRRGPGWAHEEPCRGPDGLR
ncbi:MAG: recombinase A, partial [Deferrisomatales bacterium]